MPRFAANITTMFAEQDFGARVAAAADAGFKAVECLFPYTRPAAELARSLEENRVELVLFNLPPGDWEEGERGLTALPGREQEFRSGLEQAIDYARTVHCFRLHAMAGIPPSDVPHAEIEAVYRSNLRDAAKRAEQAGIEIVVEPINDKDMPGYAMTTTAAARSVIESLGVPNIGLQYDVYHAAMMGEDPLAILPTLGNLLRHVQISGIPGRHEPDAEQNLDYPAIFAVIDQMGYRGWVGCEYRPRAGTLEGLGWARAYGIGR